MTQSIAEIHSKASSRIEQLRADIDEATKLLRSYEDELTPLLQIVKLTAPAEATAEAPHPAVTLRELVDEVLGTEGPVEETEEQVIPSRRYSQYKLAPRFRRFLDRFGDNEKVTRKEIAAWYRRALSPSVQDDSLMTITAEITRTLTAKGILSWESDGVWKFVR
jgi:hypothetical protein